MFKNMKIGIKILLVVLFMSLGTLIIAFANAYFSIDRLSDVFQHTNVSLGLTASDDSKEALQGQAEEYLTKIAGKQAMYSNQEMREISRMVTTAAGYIEYLYANSEGFIGRNLPLPDQTVDGEPCSKYALAPNVSVTDDIWREVRLLSNCEAVFGASLSENNMLDNIYVGTRSGISYRYSKSNLYDQSYDPREQKWYHSALDHPDKTIWLDTYTDSYGHMCITSARTFRDVQGNVAGVVASDIRLQDMLGEISTAKIGQSGYAFVMDKDRQLIAHPDYFENDFQKDIDAHIQTGGQLEKAQKLGGKSSGIVNLTLDGIDSYVAFSILEETGWCLCISIDRDEVIKPALDTKETIDQITGDAQEFTQDFLSEVMKKFVIFFVSAGIMVMVLSFAVARSITRPIQKLSRSVEQIGKGEFDTKVEVESADEIGNLAAAFNDMLDDLHTYINQITLITAEKERIGAELSVATQIQADMLPNIFPAFPEREEIDIYATMTPAKEVGGDFYDFFMVDDTHLAMVMADVSGKGVPAALFMVIGKTLIKDHTKPETALGDVFTAVNRLLCESNEEGLFITAFEGVLDLETGHMVYVNAGHEPPFITDRNGIYQLYQVNPGFVLAGMDGVQYTQGELDLMPGDRIFLYTDGVTEAANTRQELYGMKRLAEVLNKDSGLPPVQLLNAVKSDVDFFVGEAEQFDDITMLDMIYKKKAVKKIENGKV
ncbi:MAG: SpoIIE family protein phosphatase [Lachnospiraceae bacterium]|nr:SpoIIE family protein phosphatase [Lachnospiraceae bacterium]